MNKEEIEKVISKYRKLADSSHDVEEAIEYECFADHVEENIEFFEVAIGYETEDDLLDEYHETESEIHAQWGSMLPEWDDDDSITDY